MTYHYLVTDTDLLQPRPSHSTAFVKGMVRLLLLLWVLWIAVVLVVAKPLIFIPVFALLGAWIYRRKPRRR